MKNKHDLLPRKVLESVYGLYTKGQIKEAINQINFLNTKYSNHPILFNLSGACYKSLGQFDEAIKMFRIAIKINPNYAEAHFNLGVTFQDLGHKGYAIESYRNAIIIQPKYPDAHCNLGNIFHSLEKFEDAIDSLEWAIAYKHDFAEAYNNLGNVLYDYGKVEKAIKNYKEAIIHHPSYVKAYFNLAIVYKDLGNKEEFRNYINNVIELKPDWGHAYYHLSRIKIYNKNDPQITKMKEILETNDLKLADQIGFNFALAKAYEDHNNLHDQFKYLNQANSLRKKELNYTIDKDQKLFSRIRETFKFPPSSLNESITNKDKIRLIFIVGMPRSGTSLVHQIIDSHNEAYGVGELNSLNKYVVPLLKSYNKEKNKSFSESELVLLYENYINALPISSVKERVIVDKMPLNFRYIGFILTAFPDAKIIHMNRDPMATCWSIYKNEFSGNAYSYNQQDLAAYFSLYKNLMDFWDKLFPKKIINISYENLTKNQESETRKILKSCDLDWDEACLNFHSNKKAVKTTSSMQVRKKMYQGSSDVWKKYESYLQPLIKGLN